MDMHHGGTSSPIANLSLSDPRCNNDSCLAFYAAHNLSQAQVSYYYQYEYGHWTTWYYLILLFIFTLLYAARCIMDHRARGSGSATDLTVRAKWYHKVRAAGRWVFYRRFKGAAFDRLGLPSFGMLLFFLMAIVFLTILTFAVQPYYRGHRGYGSPPLAVRTGLMAVACTPILVALAGKANFVTMLTGIGHERLNVVHRWTAWMCFGLSVVHTIPFLVAPVRDGGYAALRKQFYKTNSYEYTGTPPLAILFGIVLFSIPWIRHRFYETFYHLHILLGITYLGLMFWHAADEQDSWAYLWASIALWVASILTRFFWYTRPFNVRSQWLACSPAALQALPGGMTRVTVVAPDGFAWRPGQHCFLRVPSLVPLDSHPFTIAVAPSAPASAQSPPTSTAPHLPLKSESESESQSTKPPPSQAPDANPTLIFLARTHAGFTRALAERARSVPDTQLDVVLDGPYGGLERRGVERAFDGVVLVAGGAGITVCLPWVQDLVRRMRDGGGEGGGAMTKRVSLLWMIRQTEHFAWAEHELRAARDEGRGRFEATVYVTGARRTEKAGKAAASEDGEKEMGGPGELKRAASGDLHGGAVTVHAHRPNIGDLLPKVVTLPRTLVIACGSESLSTDVANACARLQGRVLSGEAREVALWTERFGW